MAKKNVKKFLVTVTYELDQTNNPTSLGDEKGVWKDLIIQLKDDVAVGKVKYTVKLVK